MNNILKQKNKIKVDLLKKCGESVMENVKLTKKTLFQCARLMSKAKISVNETSQVFSLVLVLVFSSLVQAQGNLIPAPEYNLTDHNQVNMASGQLSPSLTDVSIGGDLGLTHSISTDGSEFVNYMSQWGPRDSFFAGLRTVEMPMRHDQDYPKNDITLPSEESRWKISAYFGSGSTDFYVDGNGTYINGDGSYTAERDPRHSLEYRSDLSTFVHTGPDGTQVFYYPTGDLGTHTRLHIKAEKIVYANGMTIYFDYLPGAVLSSVRTNTGYQLKYIYNENTQGLSAQFQAEKTRIENETGTGFYVEVNPATWTTTVPSEVKALNNTIEVCDPGLETCNTTQTWPTASYQWPNGMPAAMYLGDTEFTVTDASGGTTIYYHERFDTSTGDTTDIPANRYFVPRITAIKQAHEKTPFITYKYYNKGSFSGGGPGLYLPRWQSSERGALLEAVRGTTTEHYMAGDLVYMGAGTTPTEVINGSSVYHGLEVFTQLQTHFMYQVRTWDKNVNLDRDRYNRVNSVTYKNNGTWAEFEYDARGNITKKILHGGNSEIVIEAGFPATCVNAKTCNQAAWIKDANGNQTDFTYHTQSGRIETITKPAPTAGAVRPQIRYKYEQLYARYKDDSGSLVQAPDPVWMLKEESACLNGAPHNSGEGCMLGATDEIKTVYEFADSSQANNLRVMGVAVTAVNSSGALETRRTCYEYDQYGNRIGETLPKANLSSCQ